MALPPLPPPSTPPLQRPPHPWHSVPSVPSDMMIGSLQQYLQLCSEARQAQQAQSEQRRRQLWQNSLALPYPHHLPRVFNTGASAFHHVAPSRSENRPSRSFYSPNFDSAFPQAKDPGPQNIFAPACFEPKHLSSSDDQPGQPDRPLSASKSPESELPFKKRKPRPALDKKDKDKWEKDALRRQYFCEEDKLKSYLPCDRQPKDEISARGKGVSQVRNVSFAHQTAGTMLVESSSKCHKCMEMHDLNGSNKISLAGRFTSWNSQQVQVWLWRALRNDYPEPHRLCQMLRVLDNKDGSALATFTKEDWERKLAACSVPPMHVYLCISDVIAKSALQPYNFCDVTPREQVQTFSTHAGIKVVKPVRAPRMTLSSHGMSLSKPRRRRDKCVGQLWEFVYGLLINKETNPSIVCWEDEEKKLFRIVNTEAIAQLWGKHKGNSNMTYANMSRTMRYYREGNGAFVRNERKRVYGFGPKADFARLKAKIARKASC